MWLKSWLTCSIPKLFLAWAPHIVFWDFIITVCLVIGGQFIQLDVIIEVDVGKIAQTWQISLARGVSQHFDFWIVTSLANVKKSSAVSPTLKGPHCRENIIKKSRLSINESLDSRGILAVKKSRFVAARTVGQDWILLLKFPKISDKKIELFQFWSIN